MKLFGTARRAGATLATAATLAILTGCVYQPVALPPTGPGPFGRVLFLGDSLTAGFQNGALLDTQQVNGFASLIAKQAGFPISLPLIAPPGAPAVLKLESLTPLPVVVRTPGTTTGRDNPGTQLSDLAVPGHLLHDLIYLAPTLSPKTNEDLITDLVLGLPLGPPQTQLLKALADQPTTIFLWTGNNDALLGDDSGSASAMTPLASFTADYTTLIGAIKAHSNAHLVVANIPDVTAIPYMTPAATILNEVSALTKIPGPVVSFLLGIAPGDLINAQGLIDLEAELALLPLGGSLTALPGSDVLTAAEIPAVQATINAYNQVIAETVGRAGGTVVDMHTFYASFQAGLTINGYHASTAFLGGLFGLDGVHPTNTGYALIANQFIAATNTALGLSTRRVNVADIAAHDPFFGPNLHPAAIPAHIPAAAARSASQMIRGFKEPVAQP